MLGYSFLIVVLSKISSKSIQIIGSPKIGKLGLSPNSRNEVNKSSQKHSVIIPKGQMQDLGGFINITIIQGKLYRNTESIGKMDPFVELDYQGKKYTTKVAEDGHKNPLWNESFEIPIDSLDDEIKISCYDQDSYSNDLNGQPFINL